MFDKQSFRNACATYAIFDRHVNTSPKNTVRTIKTAEAIFGKQKLKIAYKHPTTFLYCKCAIGCIVEIYVLISKIKQRKLS